VRNMKPLYIAIPLRINENHYEIKKRYATYIKKENCIPIFITPENEELLTLCQGVLFPGGLDIHPKRYHEKMIEDCEINEELDEFEYHLLDLCMSLQLPIMGICRGIQLLNCYFGGTLLQDIPHHQHTSHRVKNIFFHISKQKTAITNSFHHQAILKIADGFLPFLFAEDNIIEGIIHKEKRIIAVQYHPEINDPFSIFSYFRLWCVPKDKHFDKQLPIDANHLKKP